MNLNSIDPRRVYTVSEIAKILDVKTETVNDYCRDKKIIATKIGEWKILGENLLIFLGSPSASDVSNFTNSGAQVIASKK